MRTVPLQQICDIQIGKTPSRSVPEYWGGELPWVTISDFAAGRTVTTTKEKISRIGAMKSGSKRIPRGTLLLSFKLSLGKRTIAGCDLFTNEAIAALHILNPDVAFRNYLYWALGSIDYDHLVDRAAKGKTLNKAKLKLLPIPLPALTEQKRIAEILDAADALRAKRRNALIQLDSLLQSTFIDMFGDPATNPMGWDKRRIDSVFSVARGGSPRPIRNFLTESEDGLNWIMIGDASPDSRYITSTRKRIKPEGLSKSRMVHEGDFLLTNSMSFGKPYILKTKGCIHDGWLVLSPKDKRMPADFFYSLLSTEALYREFTSKAAGAVVKNLNTKLVSQLCVPVPPLEFQHRFTAIVESVERQKASQRVHLAELDALFASLQSRAFRGDL